MENFLLKSTWPFEMIANASSLEEKHKRYKDSSRL